MEDGDFFETKVREGGAVFIDNKKPKREEKNHKLKKVLKEESDSGMEAGQNVRRGRDKLKNHHEKNKKNKGEGENFQEVTEYKASFQDGEREVMALYKRFC